MGEAVADAGRWPATGGLMGYIAGENNEGPS